MTDGYHLSPYTYKRYTVCKQFDRLNFDGLAEKYQKRQNLPHQNLVLYGIQTHNHNFCVYGGHVEKWIYSDIVVHYISSILHCIMIIVLKKRILLYWLE